MSVQQPQQSDARPSPQPVAPVLFGGAGLLGLVVGLLALTDTAWTDAVKVLYAAIVAMLAFACFGVARLCALLDQRS